MMKHIFCIFLLILLCLFSQTKESRANREGRFSKQEAHINTPFTRANPRSPNYVETLSPKEKYSSPPKETSKESLNDKAQNQKRKYPKDNSKYMYSEKYVLVDNEDSEPLAHWLVEVTFENGNLRLFISDKVGRVFEHKSVEQEYVTIKVLHPAD